MKRYITILALFIVMCSNVYATTTATSQLIRMIRIIALDPAFTGQEIFTDQQILNIMNEAQDDALSMTLCIREAYVFDTSSGTVYYSLPSDFMQIDRVLSDDQRLEEKSPAKLDKDSSEWETETGEPINYYINFASRTKIGFYPYPVTNTTTTTVKVEYYAQANTIGVSTEPFNGITEFKSFYNMLGYYTAARMLYATNHSADGDRYMQWYLVNRNIFSEYCRARPGYSPNVSVTPSR